MNEHDMTEQAYKNGYDKGYEDGKRDALKHGRCKWCNGEYHTKIMAAAIRYHSNGTEGYEMMEVNYCPNCGARMDGDGND